MAWFIDICLTFFDAISDFKYLFLASLTSKVDFVTSTEGQNELSAQSIF